MNLPLFLTYILTSVLPVQFLGADMLTSVASALSHKPDQLSAPRYQSVSVPDKTGFTNLDLRANSALAIDVQTGQPLYANNANVERPIASITKIVTALVIVRTHRPTEVVTIPALPKYTTGDEIIGLQAGANFTIQDLLQALLINSANDAADALAIVDSGSKEAFAIKMNDLAHEWGIEHAEFSNPSGLVDTGNGASAAALAQLGSLLLRNPTLADIIQHPTSIIKAADGRAITLSTTNQLLQTGKFYGIKTGYTQAAGQCFVGLTKIQGHEVITVILGSQDRFGDTIRLTDWIDANYTWL